MLPHRVHGDLGRRVGADLVTIPLRRVIEEATFICRMGYETIKMRAPDSFRTGDPNGAQLPRWPPTTP
jgi:hypothetical protein